MTNPNEQMHKEAVKSKLNQLMHKVVAKESAKKKKGWAKVGEAFGMLLGNAVFDQLADAMVSSDSYLVFSTTKVTFEGKSRVIGIGCFGNVFISEEIDKVLERGF